MAPEPDDSNLKIHELVDRQGKLSAKGKDVNTVLGDVYKASEASNGNVTQKEMPMITLKHRWMRNRNLVVGVTVFPFNDEGVAKIPNIANSSLDAAALIKRSNGLVSYLEESKKEVTASKLEKKEAVTSKLPKEEVKTEAAKAESEVEAPKAAPGKPVQPPRKPGKKGPPKKPPGRNR